MLSLAKAWHARAVEKKNGEISRLARHDG